jgi:5-methyltetrahydrofolate--homocysteine methyltransferase
MIKAPFVGVSDVITYSIDEVIENLNMQVLYKSRWKMGRGGEAMLNYFLEDERILASMHPQALYGYFPVSRQGNALILENDICWDFPEVRGKRLSDYFNTQEEGEDFIPLQVVTIGKSTGKLSKELYGKNDYAEYFLLYGLAAELTETLAKMVNRRINAELGIKKSMRRSFGYPACPDLSYQRALLELLKAERIDLTLSESNQLVPEFSTTAMIVHSKLSSRAKSNEALA